MTDEEFAAFERVQERDPAWADVAIVLRVLAKKELDCEKLVRELAGLK